MDAGRVGRLRPDDEAFQSAPRETVWPGGVWPDWHSTFHSPGTPVGVLLNRRALSGGLRFRSTPGYRLATLQVGGSQPGPGGPAVHSYRTRRTKFFAQRAARKDL